MDTLLTARNKKQSKEINLDELIGSHMDALALLGHAHYELSMKRHDAIRPSLNKDYTGLTKSTGYIPFIRRGPPTTAEYYQSL